MVTYRHDPIRLPQEISPMRPLTALLAGILVILPLVAAEGTGPNTLTAKEIAEGWLLLFDGETSFGWDLDGDATIPKGGNDFILRGGVTGCKMKTTSRFGDFVLMFDYLGEGLKK